MAAWKRLSVLWTVVKGDARLLWRALRHPQAPLWLKLGTAGLALYLLSPMDLVPDLVPALGLVDDIVLIPLLLAWMLRCLPATLRRDIGAEAGDTSLR
jgi:uncharacterized membrane protein YkvA (DUF1232 family)